MNLSKVAVSSFAYYASMTAMTYTVIAALSHPNHRYFSTAFFYFNLYSAV